MPLRSTVSFSFISHFEMNKTPESILNIGEGEKAKRLIKRNGGVEFLLQDITEHRSHPMYLPSPIDSPRPLAAHCLSLTPPPQPIFPVSPSLGPANSVIVLGLGRTMSAHMGPLVRSQPRRQGAPENTHNSVFQRGCGIKGRLTHGWLCGSVSDGLYRGGPATGTAVPTEIV